MNLVDEISDAQDLPVEALQKAARTPDRIAAGVLRALGRAAAGEHLSEREQNLAFWGVHVLAQIRDTRLFAPLLRLLRRPEEEVDRILGDAVTGTLPRIIPSVFGDAADDENGRALFDLLADASVDEFVRWNVFGALTFLTFVGRIPREATQGFLVRFDDERLARAGDATWNGWAEAVALLGFADLAPRYQAALAQGRVLDDVCDPAWFQAVMFEALEAPADPDRFTMHQFGYFGDAVEELDALLAGGEDTESEPEPPLTNPLRHVGRNDPCPCGSGRKYKKCCLEKAEFGPNATMPPLPPSRAR